MSLECASEKKLKYKVKIQISKGKYHIHIQSHTLSSSCINMKVFDWYLKPLSFFFEEF